MTTRFLDLAITTSEVRADVLARWERILDGNGFVLGKEGEEFEAGFAKLIGAEHGVAVNSGTDALKLALEAIETTRDSIVVVPANTFIATCSPAVQLGAEIRVVEPDESSLTLCIDEVEQLAQDLRKEGRRIHAVMAVHLYGQPADMTRLCDLATEYGFHIIEDCAQAHLARSGERNVGTFGTLSCWSFYPGKNLGAFGDGGAILTDDPKLAQRLRLLRNHGSVVKYQHELVGHCSRLDEIQAAVLNAKLPHLERWTQERGHAAGLYSRLLADVPKIALPKMAADERSAWHLYVIRVLDQRRDQLQQFLHEQEIQTLIHYPTPIHRHPAFASYAWANTSTLR